jgi:hypothetical protein
LEAVGGFHALRFNSSERFASSLAVNASVSWSHAVAEPAVSATGASLQLNVDFLDIDWQFSQSVYGWAALQYQAWTRGSVFNHGSARRRVTLYTDNILELWVNHEHFFGCDFYGFRRAPIVLALDPGKNVLDIRLVRDVRAMGGVLPPGISATLQTQTSDELLSVSNDNIIIPDLVDGHLPSSYMSVVVRNMDEDWIIIQDCTSIKVRKLFPKKISLTRT